MSYPLFINKLLFQKLVGGSDIFCAFHDHEWRSFRTYLLPPMCLLLLGCRWLSLSWLGKDDKHDAHLRWMLLTLPVVQLQWLLWQWVVTLLRLLTRQGRTFDCLRVPPPKIIPYRNIPLLGIPKSAIPEAQSYPNSPLVICWISPTLIFAGWFSMVPSDSRLKSHSVSVVTTGSVHISIPYPVESGYRWPSAVIYSAFSGIRSPLAEITLFSQPLQSVLSLPICVYCLSLLSLLLFCPICQVVTLGTFYIFANGQFHYSSYSWFWHVVH